MATWSKLFTNFAWKNRPDTSTPLGQTLLNRLNNAINGIDDRVVTLNAEKASTDDLNGSIVNVRLDEKTGIFTFTRFDGTTFTINTALEEVVTNFKYDNATQQLVLTLTDGTTQNVDLSALITQYEFTNSATILFTVGTDGKVTANIKPNSITDQMLQTNYLADIATQANTAVSASQSALESQSLAEQHAEEADAQANRAKAEADRAEEAADRAEAVVGITVDTTLDTNSTNPIANKAVAEAFENVDAKTLDGHGVEYFATADALWKAMRSYQFNGYKMAGNDEELNAVFQSLHDDAADLSHYNNVLISNYVSMFGGGQKWIEGYRQSANYGWQKITYWGSASVHEHWRNLYQGVWSEWVEVANHNDLAKYLPLTGGTVKTANRRAMSVSNTGGADVSIGYRHGDTLIGEIGVKDSGAYYIDSSNKVNTLLHTGNITDYVAADSETGTFSLSLSGSVVTSGNLNYCKVGKLVYVYGMVGLNKNVPANSMLTGLPFSIKNGLCVIGGIAQKSGNITTESAMFTNLTYAQGTQISNKSELNAAGSFQLALIYVTD